MKPVVGVLRGGPSSEHDVSLDSGAAILKYIPENYTAHDLYIDKQGLWYLSGVPRGPERALRDVDVVFNALHGEYGEDGHIQEILEQFRVPYTGSRVVASAVGMSKVLTKQMYARAGIKTPYAKIIRRDGATERHAYELFRDFPNPSVLKPARAGSSVGVKIIYSFDDLLDGLERIFVMGQDTLIEEYISGKEATCGLIENFREEDQYVLPPTEIIPSKNFFDYEAKYQGDSLELCPGRFSTDEKEEIVRLARLAHETLGLRHYSRTDFIVSPRRGIFVLETNTLPGLTERSLFPGALKAVGSDLPEFVSHLLLQALNG